MAEVKTKKENTETPIEEAVQKPKKDDYVLFKAFKDEGNYKDDIVVGINGKIYTIQRGVEVKIPLKVYEVLENAEKQRGVANNIIEDFEKRNREVIAVI